MIRVLVPFVLLNTYRAVDYVPGSYLHIEMGNDIIYIAGHSPLIVVLPVN